MMRYLGMSFGISLASAILSSQLSTDASRPAAAIELPAAEVNHGAAVSFIALAALAAVAALLSLARTDRTKPLPRAAS
jgi:hypothetical protein